jgi:beta-glucosidase
VGIVVLGETPYAEGLGDRANLTLPGADMVDLMRTQAKKVVLVVVSGRPVVITDLLPKVDAAVAAWLPGTEGAGVADVLSGDKPFSGKLAYTWPRSNSQLPFDFKNLETTGCGAPLFSYGYGLTTNDPSPIIPDCPNP